MESDGGGEATGFDSGMPEQKAARDVVGATLGLVGSVPVVGGVAVGAIQSALAAAARAKDEEWWAMVAARLASVEADLKERGESLSLDDPEFLAAVHRATRAAQESADSEKRRILVDALANSGSWSTQPWDRRDQLLALVVRLTPLHVRLLQYFGEPSAFVNRAIVPENSQTLSTFVAQHVLGDQDLGWRVSQAIEDLKAERLIGMFNTETAMTVGGLLTKRTTELGAELLDFLVRTPA